MPHRVLRVAPLVVGSGALLSFVFLFHGVRGFAPVVIPAGVGSIATSAGPALFRSGRSSSRQGRGGGGDGNGSSARHKGATRVYASSRCAVELSWRIRWRCCICVCFGCLQKVCQIFIAVPCVSATLQKFEVFKDRSHQVSSHV